MKGKQSQPTSWLMTIVVVLFPLFPVTTAISGADVFFLGFEEV